MQLEHQWHGQYGGASKIDRHLYETTLYGLPRCQQELPTAAREALCYNDSIYASQILTVAIMSGSGVGGLSVKFRAAGGDGGRANEHVGFAVSVPLMRVEEMKLIRLRQQDDRMRPAV